MGEIFFVINGLQGMNENPYNYIGFFTPFKNGMFLDCFHLIWYGNFEKHIIISKNMTIKRQFFQGVKFWCLFRLLICQAESLCPFQNNSIFQTKFILYCFCDFVYHFIPFILINRLGGIKFYVTIPLDAEVLIIIQVYYVEQALFNFIRWCRLAFICMYMT